MATELSAVDYLTRSVDRNRYFYGKLMTVRDFLREQEYFNSKRWLINRLLFGSGVVCGLEVARVGGAESPTLVELRPGVAFDPFGREITVSNRETVDLARLVTPGLAPGGVADVNLLVCLNYHECPKEPVPTLGGSPCDEVCESNRIGETYTVGLIKAPPDVVPPTPCENWLNRQTVSRQTAGFDVDRVAPAWVRPGEVFQVALKVTARADIDGVVLSETAAGGIVIEPNPQPPTQFPTPPVSLRRGEFFVYVYQVQAPAAPGAVQLSGGAGVPTPPTSVQVLDPAQANARESEMRLGACPDIPAQTCVPVAKVKASFNGNNLTGVEVLGAFERQRFRYSLTRVAELLDCVRASLRAEADSPRPGHAFITFKDLERTDLQPVGPTADHGRSFTVPRGDHTHALLLFNESGLKFEGNRLRVEGNVGGERINFLNPVSGQDPVAPQHLTTKHYVDSRIAGLDWQESVLTRRLDAPPERPREGDRYLVPGVPSAEPAKPVKNPWAAHPGSIATWNGRAWDFTPPDEGTAVFVDDENIAYLFVEGRWIPFLATPEVAAGDGLRADGAVLSVGRGPGLKVNPNDVEVIYEPNAPRPVGPVPAAGASATASRGDHTHALPLTPNGGLAFGGLITRGPLEHELDIHGEARVDFRAGLHINGLVGGSNIDFLNPVWGQNPKEPRHLATKQYVDGIAAGLDWQNSVLDKDLIAPPPNPAAGARYLVLRTTMFFPEHPVELDRLETAPTETTREAPTERPEATAESLRELPREILPEPGPVPFPFPKPAPPQRHAWMGRENSIATWDGNVWSFTVPNEGAAVFVEDENTAYLFVDRQWVPFMAMPSVAAGGGLRADGARLSVGQGPGLRVNENDVEVVYHAAGPAPVGKVTSPGAAATTARGDHTHELPLALSGGLEFVAPGKGIPGGLEESIAVDKVPDGPVVTTGAERLRVNGRINGPGIDFLFPVLGQDPVEPRHLTTKQYVDGVVAGLTWQRTVLDKDLTKPPAETPQRGDRYLLFPTPIVGSAWEGRQGNIATWVAGKWNFTAPTEGMAAFVADENLAYLYADGKWVQFLAPPATVGAGDGLFQKGSDLAVGQGAGVLVTPDAVSVNFGADLPAAVGVSSSPGSSRQAAQSDHTHELPLADRGGLEFTQFSREPVEESSSAVASDASDTTTGPAPIRQQARLRINGPVGGNAIDFLFPVSGQAPTDPRHLATKQYVDGKGAGVVAGNGLVIAQNVISVGGGPGLVVGADDVGVNFYNTAPRPVSTVANPGTSNSVARGDHTHAMPDTWLTSVSTGVVAFDMRQVGKSPRTLSLPIDPGLGVGAITVVLGLESEVAGQGTFVGEVNHFEDAMLEGGAFRRFQSILLGAVVIPANVSTGIRSTRFEIWAQATQRAQVLPDAFRVRWWAYRAGRDFGVMNYAPPVQAATQ